MRKLSFVDLTTEIARGANIDFVNNKLLYGSIRLTP